MLLHISADAAFNQTRKEWTSGLWIEFNGIIRGIKVNLINPGAAGKIHLRGLQSAHKSVQK